jgi:rod shape-determining protein MreC
MNRLNIALVIGLVAVGIYLSTLSSETLVGIKATFMGVLAPFLNTGSAVQQNIGSFGQRLKTLDELEVENTQLRTENQALRAENSLMRETLSENQRLRLALDFRARSPHRLVAARVISRDSSTWWNTIRINRGFEDGVEADQPVLTDIGLVGKTTTVSKNEAIVVLVTDESCRIGARIEGTREQGIVSGVRVQENALEGILRMNFLSKNAEISPGMEVLTAGVAHGSFPQGIVIGKVRDFSRRALDGQATIEPAVDLSAIEDVFVLVGKK